MSIEISNLVRSQNYLSASEHVQVLRYHRFGQEKLVSTDINQPPAMLLIPDLHLGLNQEYNNFEASRSLCENLLSYAEDIQNHFDVHAFQLGDMYELWQGCNDYVEVRKANPAITDVLDSMGTTYIVGNHDIQLKTEPSRKFSHKVGRVYLEHGHFPDLFSNHLNFLSIPLVGIWGLIENLLGGVEGSPPRDTTGETLTHQKVVYRYYLRLAKKQNEEKHISDPGLRVVAIGHTHSPGLYWTDLPAGKKLLLLDAGGCIDGGCTFGLITPNEVALCEMKASPGDYDKKGRAPLKYKYKV